MGADARLLLGGGLLAMLALGLGPGCAIDDRVLHGGDTGGRQPRGGASSGGGGGASGVGAISGSGWGGADAGSGAAQPAGAGGSDITAGSAGMGPGPGTECPDLDRSLVPDCEETLVENAGFDLGIDGWVAEPDADISWNAMDAQSAPDSGSLVVENAQTGEGATLGMVGASYCVEVTPDERYALYAEAFIQADVPSGYAGATAWFYEQPNCSGQLIEAATSPLQGAIKTWKVVRLRPIVVPPLAASMLIRMATAKELTAPSLTVRFDNVLLTR